MADEEVQSRNSTVTTYPKMIIEAIKAFGEKDGMSESSISEYITQTYKYLPSSHSVVLKYNLEMMIENGDLVLYKDKYFKTILSHCHRTYRDKPRS